MDEETIREAWKRLDATCGRETRERRIEQRAAAQAYASAVLEANDGERIAELGRRHLQCVAKKSLKDREFTVFMTRVIARERYRRWSDDDES